MRTTLAIDDDVFLAVQQQARRDRKPLGAKVSELLRQGLMASTPATTAQAATALHPYVLYPKSGHVITSQMVYDALDEMECEP